MSVISIHENDIFHGPAINSIQSLIIWGREATMAGCYTVQFCFSFSVLIIFMIILCGAVDDDRKVHIVYMGSLPKENYLPSSHHISLLQEVVEDSAGTDHLIRSYKRSFNGFAAKLNDQEQKKLAGMEGIVSVFPSQTLQLHTTRSWDFMGLTDQIERNPTVESDVIIGVIDTGIWPESDSFSSRGLSSPPRKWKGACNGGKNFSCNNKIIGARYYSSSPSGSSARDMVGHGSHTASIAAGNKVNDVSFYGLARGNAKGGVPSARIAVYAACSKGNGCLEEDILAAFDDAIADGVDIITLSLGRDHAVELHSDAIAIGSFHAMEKGILTTNSAGNSGFMLATVASVAPWILTVAASNTDRRIVGKVVLGNGRTLVGNSVNPFRSTGVVPLVDGEDSDHLLCAWYAKTGSAKRKIVMCYELDGGEVAYKSGALGSIIQTDELDTDTYPIVPFPSLALNDNDYDVIKSYINSTKNPQANILRSETIKDVDAPLVASFSSLGPNLIVPEILKPDITAPGVGILAAYSPVASPSNGDDNRSLKYSILSGTSMSCPHAAGAAAYVKSMHPDWSPSAIKSALMTTAWPMNNTKNKDGEFSYGTGHINPVKAANPGLVYETSKQDYINMLCSIGYNAAMIHSISGDDKITCPSQKLPPQDLNYPSMAVAIKANTRFKIEFHRTVTNVGLAKSSYRVEILQDSGLSVKVVPDVISFSSRNEKKSFVVNVGGMLPEDSMASAQLAWSDGVHRVRNPIVVYNSMLVPSR